MDMQDVPRMSPEELYTRMAQGEGVVVLDVRTADGLSARPYQAYRFAFTPSSPFQAFRWWRLGSRKERMGQLTMRHLSVDIIANTS